MSKRFAVSVVTLAWMAGSPAVAGEVGPADIESLLAPRSLFSAPLAAPFPAVRLVWIDPTGVAIGVDAPARAEAERLLRAMGAFVSWRRGHAREVAQAAEVRVILLDRAAERAPGAPILGVTPPRSEGAPFVWVHVPSVHAGIGLPPRASLAAMPPSSLRSLAIALGRVVAHEVVHALAPSVRHGSGLMSATLTRRQLTGRAIPVALEVSLAVRAALRGDPLATRPGTATVASAVVTEEVLR